MEDSKTKYIESSLAAFRAIKTFVFIKGIYPRNFNSGFWDLLFSFIMMPIYFL